MCTCMGEFQYPISMYIHKGVHACMSLYMYHPYLYTYIERHGNFYTHTHYIHTPCDSYIDQYKLICCQLKIKSESLKLKADFLLRKIDSD